ncbi:MAG: zinc ABC transporter substrate-binding protein [Akkermansia sp.]
MIKKILSWSAVSALMLALLPSCDQNGKAGAQGNPDGKVSIVATTTYLTDLTKQIGGDQVEVISLCGPGVDPHVYVPTAQDVQSLEKADVVVYNGVGMEGQMARILGKLETQGSPIYCAESSIPKEMLLEFDEDGTMVVDPHVWNNVDIWKSVAQGLTAKLSALYPEKAAIFQANLKSYDAQLDELKAYIQSRTAEIEETQRFLITSHDAFGYFADAFKFEVMALQGLSTATEAGTKDIADLAEVIKDHKLKAIFCEDSVSPKAMEALQAAVRAKGGDVVIGGTLYSDSLGDAESGADTYIKALRMNIDTIINALK